MPFKPVPTRVDFVSLEHDVQNWWEEHGILEKYLNRNKRASKRWSFIDGPITANNPMGVHHAWGRSYKDLYQRLHTMLGYEQRYQNGFDCQGLWIEVEVEKEMGFKNKKDIEVYGIDKFVEACKERVRRFSEIQTRQSIRLGYWMDWDNSYYTNSDENNYTIWAFLKKCWLNGWIYKGKDAMPWCPRCGTGISQHEIVTEGYQEITHKSVYLKFPIAGTWNMEQGTGDDAGLQPGESLLVWTTTPWTLAANVAAAVHPELTYVKVRQGEEVFYLSKGALATAVRGEHEVLGEVKGADLVGLTYRGPFDELPAQEGIVHRVIAWDEVSDQEGTGIVHIAPGAGAEDFALSKEYGLQVIAPLDEDGTYVVGPRQNLRTGFGFLEGKFAGDVPELVFESLRDKGLLYRVQDYTHRYPTCWRCGSELVFRLVDEWFISMDGRKQEAGSRLQGGAGGDRRSAASAADPRGAGVMPDGPSFDELRMSRQADQPPLREQIMEVAPKARWIPEFGLARELDWLKNMHDWMISKKRYYGLALPIFECQECANFEVIGSEMELKDRAVEGWEQFEGHSPHRPYIDPVRISCSNCGAKVARIKDVGNPWLDAGIVPFSTLHYRDDPEYWHKWFPADWVSESFPGQFRNWFYSLLALGTVMVQGTEFEGRPPFKALFSYALLRDEKGEEMHKSKGNAIWFEDAAERMGSDVMRWMFFRAPPANNLNFGWHGGDEIKRGFLSTLWNTYSFFVTYANIDGWEHWEGNKEQGTRNKGGTGFQPPTTITNSPPTPELDRWALSELNQLVKDVSADLADFDSMNATRRVEDFVEGLSNWYVRRSRRRFWKSEDDSDKRSAYETLWTCLETTARLLAPFLPFLAEEMWQNLAGYSGSSGDLQVARGGAGGSAGPGPGMASVHLADWPVADEALIDGELQESVRLVQRLASLGRSARAKANVKVRQPLRTLIVRLPTGTGTLVVDIRRLENQLVEELNVQRVLFMSTGIGPDGAGSVIGELNARGQPLMDVDVFDYQVRLNLPVLGQKYGSQLAEIQRLFGAMDKVALARRKLAGLPIQLNGYQLLPQEALLTVVGRAGYAAAEDSGYAVAITTEITPELADEGLARELVRRIQEMRKDAGFEISDRIRLTYDGDADVARVMQSWREYIAQETLAEAIEAGAPSPGAFVEEQDIDGRKVILAVSRL